MRATTLGLGLFALSFAPLAPAHAPNCPDPSQMGLNHCVGITYKKTDARLNAVYGQIIARLKDNAATKAKLVAAQKAWIAFRDAECTFRSSSVEGGSIYPMVVTQCLDGLTQKRIAELEPLLTCEEGDMSCPVPSAP
jgi:uncharacterized protein YecT (DUF1311 family)